MNERAPLDTRAFSIPQLGHPLSSARVECQQGVVLHRTTFGRCDDCQVAIWREDRRRHDPLAAEEDPRLAHLPVLSEINRGQTEPLGVCSREAEPVPRPADDTTV